MSGKGSSPRPFSVPPEEFGKSFEGIFGKRERVPYIPPPLPSVGCIKCPCDPSKPCKYCSPELVR